MLQSFHSHRQQQQSWCETVILNSGLRLSFIIKQLQISNCDQCMKQYHHSYFTLAIIYQGQPKQTSFKTTEIPPTLQGPRAEYKCVCERVKVARSVKYFPISFVFQVCQPSLLLRHCHSYWFQLSINSFVRSLFPCHQLQTQCLSTAHIPLGSPNHWLLNKVTARHGKTLKNKSDDPFVISSIMRVCEIRSTYDI